MTKKTCPVYQKTFTNLKRHLARRYKCKPPKEISKEISEEISEEIISDIIVDVLDDKQPDPMKEDIQEEKEQEPDERRKKKEERRKMKEERRKMKERRNKKEEEGGPALRVFRAETRLTVYRASAILKLLGDPKEKMGQHLSVL